MSRINALGFWREKYGKYYAIREKEELVRHWIEEERIKDNKVIEAFIKVKRENFVKKEYLDRVYEDIPLPIGYGATISQPTTVIILLNALELKEGQKVLEVGAGSGYLAALIGVIVKTGKVVATEIKNELVEYSKKNLKKEGITNVRVLCADGTRGYDRGAPYDRIIVSAAATKIPISLIKQLKNNGILLVPVGTEYEQRMLKIIKRGKKIEKEDMGAFLFVPLVTKD